MCVYVVVSPILILSFFLGSRNMTFVEAIGFDEYYWLYALVLVVIIYYLSFGRFTWGLLISIALTEVVAYLMATKVFHLSGRCCSFHRDRDKIAKMYRYGVDKAGKFIPSKFHTYGRGIDGSSIPTAPGGSRSYTSMQ